MFKVPGIPSIIIDIGIAEWVPRFGHLPLVLGEGTKKLSKRDPESNLFLHRERGFLPEGLLNYLALLGWSLSPDRDVFSRDELAAAFEPSQVNPNPAHFDLKKAEAINGDHIRLLDPADLADRMLPYLQLAGVLPEQPDEADARNLMAALGLTSPFAVLRTPQDEPPAGILYPVALKILSPDLAHKTEVGGVKLNIVDRASDNTISRTLKKTRSSPTCRNNGSSHPRPTPPS